MLDSVTWVDDFGHIHRSWNAELSVSAGKLRLLDQTLLPERREYLETADLECVFDAIKRLVVRGAPAIGCAAVLGLAAVIRRQEFENSTVLIDQARQVANYLASSRPTAVNLFWALKRCVELLNPKIAVAELKDILLHEALDILSEDIEMCHAIGRNGAPLLSPGCGVLTHCNAGALATGDYGTALAPVYTALENGISVTVYSDETRPLLQGARLTAWELQQAGVDVVTICDNMAAQVMREGKINIVIVGADRIALNGDTANKIGTYALAVLADYHSIPFYVAAPYSTIDAALADGSGIPIEQRDPEEVSCGFGRRTVPRGVKIYNPAFDVTPHQLITGIITEKGIIKPPFHKGIGELLQRR